MEVISNEARSAELAVTLYKTKLIGKLFCYNNTWIIGKLTHQKKLLFWPSISRDSTTRRIFSRSNPVRWASNTRTMAGCSN